MTYNERLLRVKTALLKIKEDHDIVIGHYGVKGPDGDYITWSEDVYGEMLEGDGHLREVPIQGTVDFYTKSEYSHVGDAIENALDAANISIIERSVQHEEDTGYIHTSFVWEVL